MKIDTESFGLRLEPAFALKHALETKEVGVLFIVEDDNETFRCKFVLPTEKAELLMNRVNMLIEANKIYMATSGTALSSGAV